MSENIDPNVCDGCTHQNHCEIVGKAPCEDRPKVDATTEAINAANKCSDELKIKVNKNICDICVYKSKCGLLGVGCLLRYDDTASLIIKGEIMNETKQESGEGTKFDGEKIRLDLIPPAATEGIGLVLTFGAKKYAAYNWAKGIHYSRILGAIKRHLLAIEKGEDVDPESGLLHIDHIACNAAFLQTFQRYDKYKKFDDRFNYDA